MDDLLAAIEDRIFAGVMDDRPPDHLPTEPGFHWPDNEPVDPMDCARYPESPFCGGGPLSSLDVRSSLSDLFFNTEISSAGCSACQCWVCIQSTIFLNALPEQCFNYVREGCSEPPEPPPDYEFPTPPEWDAPSWEWRNDSNMGHVPGCQYFLVFKTLGANDPLVARLQIQNSFWARALGTWGFDLDSRDVILPVYGPIESVLTTGSGFISIRCGGLGAYNMPSFQLNEMADPSFSMQDFRAETFLSTIYRYDPTSQTIGDRRHFTLTGATRRIRPHAEPWLVPPGLFQAYTDLSGALWAPRYRSMREYNITAVSPSREEGFGGWLTLARIVQASAVAPIIYADRVVGRFGQTCAPFAPPPPPIPDSNTGGDMCQCDEISALIDRKLRPIYSILGFPMGSQQPKINITPESLIEELGNATFREDSPAPVEIVSLPRLVAAISAGVYYKAGLHRLPAQLPESLVEGNRQRPVESLAEMLEWIIKNFDAVAGQFPVSIEVKGAERSQRIEMKNVAEAIAELAGLAVTIAADTDAAVTAGIKSMAEASKAGNAAIIAQDYAKATAQYLGFKGNEFERKVKVNFTPGANNRKDFFENSEQSLVSFRNEQPTKENMQAVLQELIIAAGIIKGALLQKYDEGEDYITGDYMRNMRNNESNQQQDDEWNQYLQSRRMPSGRQRIDGNPTPEIRDIGNSRNDDD